MEARKGMPAYTRDGNVREQKRINDGITIGKRAAFFYSLFNVVCLSILFLPIHILPVGRKFCQDE